MSIDCGKMTAAQLIMAVNNSTQGKPLTPRRLRSHRDKSGGEFHEGRYYSLPAYAAFLWRDRTNRKPPSDAEQYEAHKQKMAEKSRLKSLLARDIGEIPAPQFVDEVESCRFDLEKFCKTFLAGWFTKPFGDTHRTVIREIEKIVFDGGLQAIAMPRHWGKTTITKAACLWAVLYGHRKYVVWLAADDKKADDAADDIWSALRKNEKLSGAFPKVCYPLIKGGGDQRSKPLYQGREIEMGKWQTQIILPDIADSEAASAVIETGGLMTAVRGLQYLRPDGFIVRPDLVVLDDPQTDESSMSDAQCEKREGIINGAVLGLAGPGVKIAAIMPCTIIRHGDLSSRLLNRKQNPEWHGIIGKMIDTLPANMPFWEKYNTYRIRSLNEENSIRLATELYLKHQTEADRGCTPLWPEDFVPGEASAIQHAMNLYFQNKPSFYAEYQNSPLLASDEVDQLEADSLILRTTPLARWEVPDNTHVITGFIDVHQEVLYWMAVAWTMDFSGHIAAYGTFPDQRASYFNQRNVDNKISDLDEMQQKSLSTQLEIALWKTFPNLDRHWLNRTGNTEFQLKMGLVDANWHESTDAVDRFAALSNWRGKIFPSHGKGITENQKPIKAWQHDKKDSVGLDWKIPFDRHDRPWRYVVFDTNHWKSKCAEFLVNDPNGVAAITMHAPEQFYDHRLLVDHFVSEKRARKVGTQQTCDIWDLPSHRPDNHWWDCLVGCAVAASMCGLQIPQYGVPKKSTPKKKPKNSGVSYGEWE